MLLFQSIFTSLILLHKYIVHALEAKCETLFHQTEKKKFDFGNSPNLSIRIEGCRKSVEFTSYKQIDQLTLLWSKKWDFYPQMASNFEENSIISEVFKRGFKYLVSKSTNFLFLSRL